MSHIATLIYGRENVQYYIGIAVIDKIREAAIKYLKICLQFTLYSFCQAWSLLLMTSS